MIEFPMPSGSELLVGRKKVAAEVVRLCGELNRDYGDREVLYLTIMNGGQIFSSLLAQGLTFDLRMDYLQVGRYGNQTRGGQLSWLHRPQQEIAEREVLLIDDIFDQGYTMQAVMGYCREQGARSVRSVVLVEKQHAREKAACRPDYVGMKLPDRYLFGLGMDFENRWRQLPDIHALRKGQ